jgi:Ca2+-transporting ATPase
MLQGIKQSRTPLQENLDKVGRVLAVVALCVVVVIVALGLWRREETDQTIIELVLLALRSPSP